MRRPYKWADKLVLIPIHLNHRQKIIRSSITLLFIILVPIVILLLPENYFDTGESVCLSKLIFKQECYACGLTKACKHLLSLNFEKAFEYNLLSFVALPLVAFLWMSWFLQERKNIKALIKAQ